MALRVHELAKELKISTAALKIHLRDLGVSVKSHMSFIEDDIVAKIRKKFMDQVAAIKKMENARKRLYDKRRPNQEMEHTSKQSPKHGKSVKKEDKVEIAKKEIKTFVERPIQRQKPTGHTGHSGHSSDGNKSSHDYKPRTYNKRDDRGPVRHNADGKKEGDFQQRPPRYNKPGGTSTDSRYQGGGGRSNYNNRGQNQGDRRTSTDSRYQGGGGRSNYDNRGQKPYSPKPHGGGDYKPHGGGYKPHGGAPKQQEAAVIPAPVVDKKFGKSTKVTSTDLGAKSKHIQAKLKNIKRKKKSKFNPTELEQAEISRNIRLTMSQNKKKKKHKKDVKDNEDQKVSKIVISEFTSVSELAKLMDVLPAEIITKFFGLGQMVTINQRLDKESLEMICDEFDFDVSFQEEFGTELIAKEEEDDAPRSSRPPVVTIMGHVDHGKTSILDHIRNENVIAGEAGGITQHIGAYQVTYNDHKISFIDTPGHEAFTAMRARGANVTDIGIVVVAANDGVMPQTIEAIDHIRAAGVTMIVAINKIDLPEANIDRTIANLAEKNVFLEGYGGEVLWTKTSAVTGEGIDDLLELILLASEMGEFTSKIEVPSKAVVIEATKDPRMGSRTTILMQEGHLSKGESIVCGATFGKVRKMLNERDKEIIKIGPSDVAVLYGLNDVPKAGDFLNSVKNEKIARQISSERLQIRLEREKFQSQTNLNNLFQKIKENAMTELNLIIKADSDGSVEALCDSFQKLSNEEVTVNILRSAVGGIVEADVNLAITSSAIIIGFHVRANNQAKKLAEDNEVEIKYYQIIYDAIDDITKALTGMLAPEFVEEYLGSARVKQIFKIKKIGVIAGCAVEKGNIKSEAKIRLYRNDVVIHEGTLSSLKHYNEDVKEVKSGTECGIGIENFNDIKEEDVIEAYVMKEVARKL